MANNDRPAGQTASTVMPPAPPVRPMDGGWGSTPVMTSGMTFREIGQTGLRQFSGWVREEFLPQLVGRQAARVYREMADNSPIVGGMLFAIKATMRKVQWRVEPANSSAEAQSKADFVEGMIHDMSHTWDELVDENLSMLQFGFAPHEIVYKRRLGRNPGPDPDRPGHNLPGSQYSDGLIGWRRLPLRGQETVIKWFFDDNGVVKGVTQQPWTGSIVDIPIEKLLLFRPNSHKGNPEGRSVLRNSWRPYYFSTRIEEQEAIMFERFNGLPIVRVPNTLIEQAASGNPQAMAQLNAYKQMATNIRINEQMGIVISSATYDGATGPTAVRQYDIELVTPSATRAGIKSNDVLDRYAVQMMTSVMADFLHLGHSSRGTQALANNKTDMFFQAIEGYLNTNASVYTRHGLPRVWELNGFDEAMMPEIVPDMAQRVDLDVLSNFVLRLSQSGMPLFPNEELQSYLLDAAGLPDIIDPMALEASQLSDEQIAQQTAIDMGEIPDPKAVQNAQLNGGAPGGAFGKIFRASLARRLLRHQGPRFGVDTKRSVKKADEIRDVWIIRHGSTLFNADDAGGHDKIRGWKDIPLSPRGIEQARAVAVELSDSGIQVLAYSTLERAKDTAVMVADTTQADLVAVDWLKPWNVGLLTGTDSNHAFPILEEYVNNPTRTVPGGESFNSYKIRAFRGIKQALDISQGMLLAIVTHHRVERLVKGWIAAGSKPDLSIDKPTMMQHGDDPGEASMVQINVTAIETALRGFATNKRNLNGKARPVDDDVALAGA